MEKDIKKLENWKEKFDQLNIIEKNKEDSNSTHDPGKLYIYIYVYKSNNKFKIAKIQQLRQDIY
jgi:hypothetical protein